MSKAMTIAEAKAHFLDCVKSAEGGQVVVITRDGRAAAAVVSAKYLADLEARANEKSAQQGLAALVGRFPDGDDFASSLERTASERGSTRKGPRLR